MNDSISPEVQRCITAYIGAYNQAASLSIPDEAGARTLVAKLAYESQWNIELIGLRPLVNPKGLVS